MTKADILQMKTSREIIGALLKNPHLIDKETSEYQKKVAQAEKIAKYGTLDVIFDPFKK